MMMLQEPQGTIIEIPHEITFCFITLDGYFYQYAAEVTLTTLLHFSIPCVYVTSVIVFLLHPSHEYATW